LVANANDTGARPGAVASPARETGLLPLPGPDEGVLFVPESYRPGRPTPLIVSLHGCCGEAVGGLGLVKDAAESAGAIVAAPEGTGGSWDVLSGGFGPDVEVVDAALIEVFASYSIDRERVAISGFSDGASYALSLGLTNGDLFTHVIAHSPGFMAPGDLEGRPEVFIAHGREDRTLPFSNAEEIVADLESEGYRVVFRPFDAGHRRQPHIFAQAVRWFLS
jgi:phospholipase/carboxylesterase